MTKREPNAVEQKDGGPSDVLQRETPRESETKGSAAGFLTVSQLNRRVKELIDGESGLHDVLVLGEFSNLKPAASGHLYPTLKDGTSEIQCVIWAGTVNQLSISPREGMKVFVLGDVGVYEQKGRYQLYVTDVKRFGIGDLYAQLEALKIKLKEEGLFARKRPLPQFPEVIGLVTSDGGAAVRDMIRILGRRFPVARIVLVPVMVQGAEAAEDIASGVHELNNLRDPRPDVIIVGRGGGSIEDLWAFNQEVVARAIFASEIPIVSGIGHETDFTIADFVADLRAATPSEAAEKVVPDKENLLRVLTQSQAALVIETTELLGNLEQGLDEKIVLLNQAMEEGLEFRLNRINHIAELLASLNPRKVLTRGYAVVRRNEETVNSIALLHPGDDVEITVIDGRAEARIRRVTKHEVT